MKEGNAAGFIQFIKCSSVMSTGNISSVLFSVDQSFQSTGMTKSLAENSNNVVHNNRDKVAGPHMKDITRLIVPLNRS